MPLKWEKPKRRSTKQRYDRAHRKVKEEPEQELDGYVQDKDATEGEERAARALSKRPDVKSYVFRDVPVGSAMAPGSVELDFFISTDHGNYMVQIDSDKWHDVDKDTKSDAVVNHVMSGRARPVVRRSDKDFETQKKADQTIAEVLE